MSLAQQLLQGNAAKKTGSFLPNVQRRNKPSSTQSTTQEGSILNSSEKTDLLSQTTTITSTSSSDTINSTATSTFTLIENPLTENPSTEEILQTIEQPVQTQIPSIDLSLQNPIPNSSETVEKSQQQQISTSPSSNLPTEQSAQQQQNTIQNNNEEDDIIFMGETPAPFDSTIEAQQEQKKKKKKKKKKSNTENTTENTEDKSEKSKSKKKKRTTSEEPSSSSTTTDEPKKKKKKKNEASSSTTESTNNTTSEPRGITLGDYIYETEAGIPLKSSERERNSLAKKLGHTSTSNHSLELYNDNQEFVLQPEDEQNDLHFSNQDDLPIIMDNDEEEHFDDDEEDARDNSNGPDLVPRLRIADDGSLVFDETATITHEKQVSHKDYVRVTETHRHITQYTFARRKRAEKWSQDETDRFYSALRQFGVNFTLIGRLFPGRDRRQIKNKYKKEERNNKEKIDYCLKHPTKIDFEMFQKYSAEKDELEGTVSKKKKTNKDDENESVLDNEEEAEDEFEEERVGDKSTTSPTKKTQEEEDEEWEMEDVNNNSKTKQSDETTTQVIVEEDENAHTSTEPDQSEFQFDFY